MADRLRELALLADLTVTQLVARSRLGRTTVSQALNGSAVPSERTVLALAQALRTPAEPLLRMRRELASPVDRPAGADPDREFEERYRRYLVGRHSRLDIIGLDLSRPERARWPLDTAYLSLELTSTPEFGRGLDGGRPGSGPLRVERAEQALARSDRVLVRGHAGSGKTTLLQWLAVATAGGRLPAELARLDASVPFLLPLRTLVRRGSLPAPGEFLGHLECPLTAAQPSGWADRVLADGRALLLLDGVDEVPQAERERTYRWLGELIAAFPSCFYAVTTRPSAVEEGRLADERFSELTVRPMNARDVAVFVGRWHTAARAGAGTPEEACWIGTLEEQLQDTVRAQRDLAQLATTPLLCALVCALNRDRRGHLPRGRMALYEAALAMLMVRRDTERDITAPEGVRLDERQSVQLLQRLAYWMLRNGQTEATRTDAERQIAGALPAMPNVAAQGDAARILDHLIARSGLLRQPSADTVDFIHRTFQDHLAAKAAVEARDFGLLDRHATDDQWEDVLRMAVAHARPDEAAQLLLRLLSHGERVSGQRIRLHVLAAACLEHVTELAPEVRAQVVERVARLLPPRTLFHTEHLAECGPMVLDLLPDPQALDDGQRALVARTALIVGGEPVLPFLKRFRGVPGRALWQELGNGWNTCLVDPGEYAREILAHCPGEGLVTAASASQVELLPPAATFPVLRFDGTFTGPQLAAAPGLRDRNGLVITGNAGLTSLEALRGCRATHLTLIDCPRLRDLSALADLPLRSLSLSNMPVVELAPLRHLPGLKQFTLLGIAHDTRLAEIPALPQVTVLALGVQRTGTLSLRGIGRWQCLRQLVLGTGAHPEDLEELTELTELRGLALRHAPRQGSGPFPAITSLTLDSIADELFETIATTFPGLRRLVFTSNVRKAPLGLDLSPLRALPGLVVEVPEDHRFSRLTGLAPGQVVIRPSQDGPATPVGGGTVSGGEPQPWVTEAR
ncbi:NACHT domain-containing protein [Kitasatospora nipponensis]|uniref:NACHT domain-containing protein n=1 Tax=Kitasatospora nipponensis TaxID=258049 RepID=A0ABP4HM27_9ACTN